MKKKTMRFMQRTLFRAIQYITGFHRIHHVRYSYGWKIPFIDVGWFPNKSSNGKRIGFRQLGELYHNCTLTGVY